MFLVQKDCAFDRCDRQYIFLFLPEVKRYFQFKLEKKKRKKRDCKTTVGVFLFCFLFFQLHFFFFLWKKEWKNHEKCVLFFSLTFFFMKDMFHKKTQLHIIDVCNAI